MPIFEVVKCQDNVNSSYFRDGCFSLYKLDNIQQKPNFIQHIMDCHENGELEVTAVELVNNTNQALVVTASNYSPQLCFWCFDSDENNDNNSTSVRDCQSWFYGKHDYDSLVNTASCFKARLLDLAMGHRAPYKTHYPF